MPKLHFKTWPILLFAIAVCIPVRFVFAWQTPDAPPDRIVVLNNRHTFDGKVSQADGKISVRLPSGSRIVLPQDRVMFVCENLPAAYWELAARTRPTDSDGQINVFKWCLRNRLFDEATNHLLMLQEMDISAKTLMQLDVSMQISQSQHRRTQEKITSVAQSDSTAPVVPTKIAAVPALTKRNSALQPVDSITIPDLHLGAGGTARRLPRPQSLLSLSSDPPSQTTGAAAIDQYGNEVDSAVQQVTWEQPITNDVTETAMRPTATTIAAEPGLKRRLKSVDTLTYSNLDRLTLAMPKGAVGLFQKQVHPLLETACAQCHQSQGGTASVESVFQIQLASPRSGPTDARRMQQKNLYQALILSQRERPEKSPLLGFATTAHGGQDTASFNFVDPALDPLKRWLIMISDNPSLPVEAFASPKRSMLAAPASTPSSPNRDLEDPAGSSSKKLPTPRSTGFTSTRSNPPRISPPRKAPAASESNAVDPFDADIFNQKHW